MILKNSKMVIFLIIIFSMCILTAFGCSSSDGNIEEEIEEFENIEEAGEPEPSGIFNPLTGLYVDKVQNLTAVMVDNHGLARPQSGLSRADIIYEIEAEGMITRFLALFYGDPPKTVGPVRSARPYYLQIAKEWDAYYAHVGGSDDAFAKIVEWRIRDIDDTKGHKGFFLDRNRQRPHSTYLDFEKALAGKAENGIFKDWEFTKPTDEENQYHEVSFRYNAYNNVKYVWDDTENAYMRYVNNSVHIDRLGGQLWANNIIFQYAKHKSLNTKLDHIWVDVVGSGKAEYFLGNQYLAGTWEKKDINSPTKFYDEHGNHIKLVEGQTWIQIIRPETKVSKL